jgi:hypothetical protein
MKFKQDRGGMGKNIIDELIKLPKAQYKANMPLDKVLIKSAK